MAEQDRPGSEPHPGGTEHPNGRVKQGEGKRRKRAKEAQLNGSALERLVPTQSALGRLDVADGRLRVTRLTHLDGQGSPVGKGYCGFVADKDGFEDEIRSRWGGGDYTVCGNLKGKWREFMVEIPGEPLPLHGSEEDERGRESEPLPDVVVQAQGLPQQGFVAGPGVHLGYGLAPPRPSPPEHWAAYYGQPRAELSRVQRDLEAARLDLVKQTEETTRAREKLERAQAELVREREDARDKLTQEREASREKLGELRQELQRERDQRLAEEARRESERAIAALQAEIAGLKAGARDDRLSGHVELLKISEERQREEARRRDAWQAQQTGELRELLTRMLDSRQDPLELLRLSKELSGSQSDAMSQIVAVSEAARALRDNFPPGEAEDTSMAAQVVQGLGGLLLDRVQEQQVAPPAQPQVQGLPHGQAPPLPQHAPPQQAGPDEAIPVQVWARILDELATLTAEKSDPRLSALSILAFCRGLGYEEAARQLSDEDSESLQKQLEALLGHLPAGLPVREKVEAFHELVQTEEGQVWVDEFLQALEHVFETAK